MQLRELVGARRPIQHHIIFGRDVQAIFFRRRHQPRRPPTAKIRPGRPAPAMGPGTAEGVPMISNAPNSKPLVQGKMLQAVPNVSVSFIYQPAAVVLSAWPSVSGLGPEY